jgi:hypothetical protein
MNEALFFGGGMLAVGVLLCLLFVLFEVRVEGISDDEGR